ADKKENGGLKPAAPQITKARLLRGALRRGGQPRLVAIRGVLLDQTALRGLVDHRETGPQRFLVGVAALDAGSSLLERRAQLRLAGAVTRLLLFSLPSLFLGRGNVRHEICSFFRLLGFDAEGLEALARQSCFL